MLFLQNSYLREFESTLKENKSNHLILEKTTFYANSGGQPGDTGTLKINEMDIDIVDTIKDSQNNILHITNNETNFDPGKKVTGKINWDRRYKHMRMHSALHLLCSVVPFGVTGGQIGYDKSRLDFDVRDNKLDKNEIQEKMNELITSDHEISYQWITNEELDSHPELVRTMSVKPPRVSGKIRLVKIGNIDLQPCGGTHVKNTKEIGKIIIQKIENKGKKNRRINITLD